MGSTDPVLPPLPPDAGLPPASAPLPPTRPLWVEVLQVVAGSLLLAFFIITYVGRAFTVEGPSMYPTLHSGERLIVDELTYRFRDPARGDIVVFRYPADPSEYFVKRLVGLPGEVVEIRAGHVYVNGRQLSDDFLTEQTLGDFGPAVVPDQHYFVLGDNRNNSADSRDPRVGFVPRSFIVGRALWRYWPLTRVQALNPPEQWQTLP